MDSIKIPLVPQWNLISSCTSTPNDGFLYIGSKCINYVSKILPYTKIDDGHLPEVKVFHTRQQVKGIDCDPDWSKEKYFAALVGDNSVQIWDFDKGKAKIGHKAHIRQVHGDGDGPPLENVRMCFLKNRTVLSVDSSNLVILCLASNTYIKKRRIIPLKHDISIIKGSPYDENIFAAGTTRGLILLVNLKNESTLFTLRGHDTEITSLSWNGIGCNRPESLPLPTRLSEETLSSKPTLKTVTNTTPKSANKKKQCTNNDDIFDIYDYDYLENEFGAPPSKVNYKSDDEYFIKHNQVKTEPDFVGSENFDFAEACQNLKEDIIALKTDSLAENDQPKISIQVDLNDCKLAIDTLGSKNNSVSTVSNDGSLEMLDRSSEESSLIANHELVHKVDVHHPGIISKLDDVTDSNKIGQPKDVILASGSHESVVWIWDTKNGSAIDKIHLKTSSQNSFIEVCWLNQDSLLTNTRAGELVLWEKKTDETKQKTCFKQSKRTFSHRGVVSLCKLKNSETIWTISFYREITCEDINENKIIAKYSCASTNIASIRERPDDMNKIGFACADRRIGILNISNISSNNIYIENCANKIESAVMSIAWSSYDSLLAFGTMEGRIGILDSEKPANAPVNFNPFCGKPIYCIQWQENKIFACGNKKIAVYSSNKKNKDPFVLENINDASTLSLHGRFLLVGTNSGAIELYCKLQDSSNLKYELISSKSVSSKYISEISWSPIRTTHCVVVSLTNKIWVLSLTNDGKLDIEKTYYLGDNALGNASAKWSNRNENLFLTCGFDGAVRIWDISNSSTEKCIFLKQFNCPMLCGLFSPIDENVIICAGKATSIEMFNMKTEKGSEFSKSMWKRNKDKAFADVQWATKMVIPNTNPGRDRKKNRKQRGIQSNIMSTTEESETKEVIKMLEKVEIAKDELHTDSSGCGALFLKNHSTMLHLVAKESNKDALENLMKVLQDTKELNDVKSKKLLSQRLFGSRDDVKELLDEELRNHQTSGTKSIANLLIPQITGDLKEEILKCVQNKKMTEWHVSLAPTISYDFWKKCCIAYAHQLLEYGLVLQASTYLLACHDVTEVIEQFLNGNYYREAWMIGKIYRELDDPILEKILDKWISYLEMNGHFEGAAFICALSRQYKKCHDILNKRQRPTGEHSKILDFLTVKLHEDNQQ
ncbi:protein rigor mortis [Condylostylus longicornis]|uniref:protein rigor mortis n=1 Tax=Condylostylus longicornis TaxID=2530218 RepID=UPI00244DC517|nr:protein rigor mortis [Condylostylus longicornis]XP_055379596.1 protein rigor mortis [Condylostylus longicornis]XP_055379597.1 protein rigor mortis [Condylostylus longicornis]XP_055379598.1 protein rigor mortis [Condylostylus longicornis]XP_055379599.1 protein rigor mortis [Condylostylus longicornis]